MSHILETPHDTAYSVGELPSFDFQILALWHSSDTSRDQLSRDPPENNPSRTSARHPHWSRASTPDRPSTSPECAGQSTTTTRQNNRASGSRNSSEGTSPDNSSDSLTLYTR